MRIVLVLSKSVLFSGSRCPSVVSKPSRRVQPPVVGLLRSEFLTLSKADSEYDAGSGGGLGVS